MMPSPTQATQHADAQAALCLHGVAAQPKLQVQPRIGAHLPAIARNIGHLCPISLEPVHALDDAVHADDGYIYDRAALHACLRLSHLSPVTRLPMPEIRRTLLGVEQAASPATVWLRRPPLPPPLGRHLHDLDQLLPADYVAAAGFASMFVCNLADLTQVLSQSCESSALAWLPNRLQNRLSYGCIYAASAVISLALAAMQLQKTPSRRRGHR